MEDLKINNIEEEAEKYAGATQFKSDYPYHKQSSYDGFKAGVEFAHQWFDIHKAHQWFDIHKEEPEYYQVVLADNEEYMAVVARVSDGNEDYYSICGTDFYMNPNPIKWRLIEPK